MLKLKDTYKIMSFNKYIKYFLVGGVFLASGLSPFFVSAFSYDSATSSRKVSDIKQEIQKKREDLKDDIQEMRQKFFEAVKEKRQEFQNEAKSRLEELKKKLGAQKGERIEKFFNNMVRKFESALDRLNDLAKRIDSRLSKAAANGKDVSALKLKLEAAKVKITDAQNALNDAKSKYGDAVKGTDFKASFKKVKDLAKDVAAKMKDAHRALVDIIDSMKGLGIGSSSEDRKATTTNKQ